MLNTNLYTPVIGKTSYKIHYPAERDSLLAEAQTRYEDGWWMYTWNCGTALSEFLVERNITDKNILEVGPGLGLASIVALKLGNTVSVVDKQPSVKEYLITNAEANDVLPPTYVDNGLNERDTYEIVMAATILYDNSTIDYLLSKLYEKVVLGGQLILVEYYNTHASSKIHAFIKDNNLRHIVYERDVHELGDAPPIEESYFVEIFVISKD